MGTKTKYWLENPGSGRRVMVKYARPNTGEDWSEKLAYELGRKLAVPCPRVDLFTASDGRGVLCWDFLRTRRSAPGSAEPSLIHGNELLFKRDPQYPTGEKYGVRQHTLDAVYEALSQCEPLRTHAAHVAFKDGFDTFVGYLMLDALIANTDRHHENWGVISKRTQHGHRLTIAPSYDHASSLGRELNDTKRQNRLGSSGRGTIADYAKKAVSALRGGAGEELTVLEILLQAAQLRPAAFHVWKSQLESATLPELLGEVERVPSSHLTETGKRFVRNLLEHNYHRVLETTA